MLAAALLVSCWAQAEQAPAPPPPPPQPGPPAAPPPGLANGLALLGRFAYRVGNEGQSLGPAAGFSLGGSFEHRYLQSGANLELGAAVDFFYDRFATAVVVPGAAESTRALAETSFALLQTAAWRLGPVRPFAALGLGAIVAHLSTPELSLRPGSMTAVQPLARVAAGFDVALSGTLALTLRGDFTHTFTRPTYTTDGGQSYALLGDLLHAGMGIRIRF